MKTITNKEYEDFQLLRRIHELNTILRDIFKAEKKQISLKESEIKTRKGKQLAKKWKTLRETLKQYDERITK